MGVSQHWDVVCLHPGQGVGVGDMTRPFEAKEEGSLLRIIKWYALWLHISYLGEHLACLGSGMRSDSHLDDALQAGQR